MILFEKDTNNENQTIQIKRSTSTENLFSQKRSISTLRQVQTILYRTHQTQYQIKVSHHLYPWEIPYKYYQMNMDPVKAFLQNNTIRNYTSRVYWNNKFKLY